MDTSSGPLAHSPTTLEEVAVWTSTQRSIFLLLLEESHDIDTPISDAHLEKPFIGLLKDCPHIPQPVHLKPRAHRERIWKDILQAGHSTEYARARYLIEVCTTRPGHSLERSQEDEDHEKRVFTDSAFQGNAVNLFCEALPRYAEAFDPRIYYGRIIAWYGSSGEGKSKGIHTLQKIFPTFTVCFRNSDDPSKRWPPAPVDLPIISYFAKRPQATTRAEEWVAAFLGSLFHVAAIELEKYPLMDTPDMSAAHLASLVYQTWNCENQRDLRYEATTRGKLFQAVADHASALLKEHENLADTRLIEPSTRYDELWTTYCEKPARRLMGKMSATPFCFFALDECTEIPGVRSIHFHRILGAGSRYKKLWFILVGTNATVHALSPTSFAVSPSQRFVQLWCLPPWCYFGYGQLAPADPSTPVEALKVDYLRKVGRPLFATYRTASAAYSNAYTKLFSPRARFDCTNSAHILTVFSHRILLDPGNTQAAHEMAADSVNYNLRYPIRIDGGGIVRTVCPSEPLLSLIASDALNDGDNFLTSLDALVEAVKNATIDRGQEGELYSRLLIIRARDFALQRRIANEGTTDDRPSASSGIQKSDSFSQKSFTVRTISLEEHLAALIHFDRLDPTVAAQIRAFSRPYHVNVTHMIKLLEPVSALPQTYLRQLFIRGAAVQCCRSQPVIDGFFVAYRGDLDKPFDLDHFILVSWQAKTKAGAVSLTYPAAALTGPMQIDGQGRRCKPAELVLVFDLNATARFKTGNPYLQATYRPGVPPTPSSDNSAKDPKPWAGHALPEESDARPNAWCLTVRGHTMASYPCLGQTSSETAPPGFNELFSAIASVRDPAADPAADEITRLVADHTLAALQPLGTVEL
ncbi:hypothetical protein DFH06DRAFT_288422 [Mycena polygramma]|nr:hypothetical protein DFH06DRAFT_288422 [Mycena polygramma]